MHKEVKSFIKEVKKIYGSYFWFTNVLEFGSQNINGSPRSYFWFCDYVGVDLGYGKGVDIICKAHEFKCTTKFDVVVSTEMLEHDSNWCKSLRNMYNCLKPLGLMIITCAAPGRAPHGFKNNTPQDSPFTNDYYRNISIEDFKEVLPAGNFEDGATLYYERDGEDLFFMGIKKDSLHFRNYV